MKHKERTNSDSIVLLLENATYVSEIENLIDYGLALTEAVQAQTKGVGERLLLIGVNSWDNDKPVNVEPANKNAILSDLVFLIYTWSPNSVHFDSNALC